MATFNTRGATSRRARGATPLGTSGTATLTHEGGAAHRQDPRSELFRLTLASFVSEDSFYESGDDKMARVRALVEAITAEDITTDKADSGRWFAGLVGWMRGTGNIRTAAVLTAAEVAAVRVAGGHPGFTREVVSASMARADEPGEFVAYWRSTVGPRIGRRSLPTAVKRGLSDAAVRLYDEYATLRYDTDSHAVRFGDVVELAQPRTNARAGVEQNDALLRHLIDRRHAYNDSPIPESLVMLRTRAELEAMPVEARRVLVEAAVHNDHDAYSRLRDAGMSWEWLAGWLQGPMDAAAWTVATANMGYMAMLRNLRNFDKADIPDEVVARIQARLADPEQVAKSRQLPFRFLSAYKAVESDRWREPLGKALDAATQNIPELPGRTLVMTDTSGSMTARMSERSQVMNLEAAALFAVALAKRQGPERATFVRWASSSTEHKLTRGASVLRQVEGIRRTANDNGMGTNLAPAVQQHYAGHDRVVVFTDMQVFPSSAGGRYGYAPLAGALDAVPANVPVYAFDLGGYAASIVDPATPNRHQLSGLSDATFKWINTVEAGDVATWPWETTGE